MTKEVRKKSEAASNEMTDWYSKIPKKLLKKAHNPHYEDHLIKLPFRMCIIGPSGSRKTTMLIEMIKRMKDTFLMIVVCCKSRHEPLYDYLATLIPNDQLMFFEGVENIPPVDEFKNSDQTLIVFDDLVTSKNQREISEFYVRARKYNVSCVYLSQSYFSIPKIIRLQCNYIVIKKLGSKKDLRMILNDNSLGIDMDDLEEIYNYATNNPFYFLLIDVDENNERKKFRRGFLEFVQIE